MNTASALKAVSVKLTGTAPDSGSIADMIQHIADHVEISTTGLALLGAEDGAVAREAIGAPGQADAQDDSTASDVAGLVADFNALLAKLRTAGILAQAPEGQQNGPPKE